jgi:ketosteroid isomerase-like protein
MQKSRESAQIKMRKFILFLFVVLVSIIKVQAQSSEVGLNNLIDSWHISAAKADFNGYFNATTADFVFLGTAPGERWNKVDFQSFCKPYFDKGKAWDFKPSNRIWKVIAGGNVAYFDEDLATWMESCRGSGVCVLENGEWKIAYYNLTVLIENEKIKQFIKLRKE